MAQPKKELNFELNLLPVISLLAVCICFLLLTTIWTQIGTIDIRQALGSEKIESTATEDKVTLSINAQGQLNIVRQNDKGASMIAKNISLEQQTSSQIENKIAPLLQNLSKNSSENLTALLQPSTNTNYETLVQLMDILKRNNFKNIGIAPL